MNPAEAMAAAAASGGGASMASVAALDPEEAKKEELQNNPDFKKVLKALKMGIPALQIRS